MAWQVRIRHGRTVQIKWERHILNPCSGTAWQGNGMGAAWERHALCESVFNDPPYTTRTKTVNQTSRKFCVYHSSNNYGVWKLTNQSVSWQRYWLCTIMEEKSAVITYSSTSLSTSKFPLLDTSSSFVCQCQNVHQLELWGRKVIKKLE